MDSGSNGDDNASTAGSGYDPSKDPKRKAKSKDPGWKYGYWPDLQDKNLVRCTLCGRDIKGGIKRIKQHLVGGYRDVSKCIKTTLEISREMHEAILRNKKRKPEDLNDDCDHKEESPLEVEEQIHSGSYMPPTGESHSQASMRVIPSSGTSSKRKKAVIQSQVRGPMDAYVRRTPEEVVAERRGKGPIQTTIENHYRSDKERKRVRSHIAKCFYENDIPFNAIKSESFKVMVESIGQYGPGFKPPSYHDLRGPLLKDEKAEVDELKKKYENYWKKYGCTLMFDGWTDKGGRHLINFLINCPEGTYFMGSVDASNKVQDANMLFQLLDNKIEEIGEENVMQVVTNNAVNYVAAGTLLMQKRTKLYWTPCASHCLDLMLEDIGNLKAYRTVVVKGRRVRSYIYRHTHLLEAIRTKINGKDLMRAGVTRFATSFLTLQSLLKHRDALRQLFVSDYWKNSILSMTEMGKKVTETVLATTFWNDVQDYLRVSQPLFIVLGIVDCDERPAMPEVYIAIEEAKKKIKQNFGDKERLWKKVINIIDRHWECQIKQPLYAAAFFLNPNKYFQAVQKDPDNLWQSVNDAFNNVVARLVPDKALQDKISAQSSFYSENQGTFAKPIAIRLREKLNPISWWKMNGGSAPDLARFALCLLGLCCSSSGCERNWSTFEFIHTKKRNILEHQHLNDLVYIQYNRRLQARFQEKREQGRNFDPLVLDELDWNGEWVIGQVDDELVYPGDDLTWRDVDRVVGSSTSSNEEEFEEEDVHDDEDIEEDFGLHPTYSAGH